MIKEEHTDEIRERFFRFVSKSGPNGCWVWLGGLTGNGYGAFYPKLKSRSAHRWSYENSKGGIPKGLTIDHLCRNRACVNPEHLEAVTIKENILRGQNTAALNARKTHCLRGHELTPENVYNPPNKPGRYCRECKNIRQRAARRVDALATNKEI